MEDNKIQQPHDNNKIITDTLSENEKEQTEIQQKSNKNSKKKLWIIIGIIAGIIVAVCIVVGVLAANDTSDDNSCPVGEYRVCGPLDNGESACGCDSDPYVSLKPIIYLYPENELDVTVRLGAPEKITASYPKYINGWNVTAYPNGDLVDKSSGDKLYSLYWEGKRDTSKLNLATGFVVKGEDSAEFLEEKLETLGLNYKEKEEFIVYWLPKLEANKYNYIYFATAEEIASDMPLEFSVQPDTLIRVSMVFEGLDEYIEIEEQALTPAPERSGFTVVEWGGTDLTK